MITKTLGLTWQYVEKWSDERPHAEALVYGDKRHTWKEFSNLVDRVAKAFIEIGVEKGDRVAMMSMARPEFLTTYMAANKIGAMWLGLNPKFTIDELVYQIDDCQPKVIIAIKSFQGNDLAKNLKELIGKFPCVKKLLILDGEIEGTESFTAFTEVERGQLNGKLKEMSSAVDKADSALLMYTSGSTGKPKGVVQTHASIVSNIEVMIERFHMTPDDKILLHFPINHVASNVEIAYSAIMSGASIVFMDQFIPAASLEMVHKEKVTILGQVPVMYFMQMQTPQWKEIKWYKSLRIIIVSGAAPSGPLVDELKRIKNETGCISYNAYGSTEACGLITYSADDDPPEFIQKSIGKVPSEMEFRLVDEINRDVKTGETGEMTFRGPFLFKEYYNKPEQTKAAFDERGFYHSNDLAYQDEEGNLFIAGRKSEMFKTGGENVFPQEIEEILSKQPGVMVAAVVAKPDEKFQEVGVAFIMRKPGVSINDDFLREACREKLANYKVPKEFIIRDELPLLATGKINKVELKKEISK